MQRGMRKWNSDEKIEPRGGFLKVSLGHIFLLMNFVWVELLTDTLISLAWLYVKTDEHL